MKRRRAPGSTAAAPSLALLLALLTLPLCDIDRTPPTADEFVVGYDARRLLAGEVPFRDFHAIEPPGAIVLHALLYRALGTRHLVSRVVASFTAGLIAAVVLALLRRAQPAPAAPEAGSRWPGGEPSRPDSGVSALAAAVAAGLGPHLLWPYPTAHGPAALLALTSLLAVARRASPARLLAAGALAALAALFHPAFGLAALGGLLVTLARPRLAVGALALATGVGAVAGAALLALQRAGALAAARAALLWPLLHYRGANNFNDVPLGAGVDAGLAQALLPGGLAGAVGAAAFALLALCTLAGALLAPLVLGPVALLAARRPGKAGVPPPRIIAALWVAGLCLVALQIHQRPDLAHLGFACLLLFPAAAALAPPTRGYLVASGRALVVAAAASSVTLLAARLGSGGAGRPRFDEVAQQWPVVRALRDRTAPGDSIAVLPAGGFYCSYARPEATGYSWLLPPAAGYHDQHDYALAAERLSGRRARLVWFTSPEAQRDFLEHAGPLSQALQRDYVERSEPGGPGIFERRER